MLDCYNNVSGSPSFEMADEEYGYGDTKHEKPGEEEPVKDESNTQKQAAVSAISSAIQDIRTYMLLVMAIGGCFWMYCFASVLGISTVAVAPIDASSVFVGTGFLFLIQTVLSLRYDVLVKQRHILLQEIAERSQRIVQEIFPKTVRERLLQQQQLQYTTNQSSSTLNQRFGRQRRRRSTGDLPFERSSQSIVVANIQPDAAGANTRPIVDHYKSATVLFADIAGFTSWSSARDPIQVFTLLEHLYAAFDLAAAKHKIFKVETIGDSYMAVAGLPDPDTDHAVHMARFSHDMLVAVKRVTFKLEAYLGAGTSSLDLRIGMHSGPVTAGVLRGQKARFQLFGDTVNTASRMESHGAPGKVQVSQATADLIFAAGKTSWLEQRTQKQLMKGKGELVTFWLIDDQIIEDSQYGYSSPSRPEIKVTKITNISTVSPNNKGEEVVMIPKLPKQSSTKSCFSQPRHRTPARNIHVSSTPSPDLVNGRYTV